MKGKRILFVLMRAGMGGSCASMLNLLSLYKEQGVGVDLFLMEHSGVWTEVVAKYANLLPENVVLASAIKEKQKLRGLFQYLCRVGFVLSHRLWGEDFAIRKLYQTAAKRLSDRYDHVIAYQESATTAFASYIRAPHKAAWVHTDFERFWNSGARDAQKEIYDAYQDVVCVTDASVQSVIKNLGYPENRVHLIRNTLPELRIKERSAEAVPAEHHRKKPFLFVSVGRLSEEKAFERIPQAARLLADKGIDFDWYLIGDGVSRENITNEVTRFGVKQYVHLLGAQMNPYPYIAMADCLVITSRYEAQPMVANEALILDRPVVSTEFASVREVIKDGENGVIVPQTPEAIADALERFVKDTQYRQTLCDGAKAFRYSNEREILAVENLLAQ